MHDSSYNFILPVASLDFEDSSKRLFSEETFKTIFKVHFYEYTHILVRLPKKEVDILILYFYV